MNKYLILFLTIVFIFNSSAGQQPEKKPVRIGIAGLSHSHVVPLLRSYKTLDFELVGIFESNTELAMRYADQYGIDKSIIYSSLDDMLDKTKPEGVVTFTSIFDHLKVVEACAPRGIDVMVEKPLAVSNKHAQSMLKLVEKNKIKLLTNFETSWYSSNQKSYEMISQNKIGDIRKIIVYDGHKGPKEIGVNKEFLEWLADPVGNGGGAVIDFGCYGADLVTWIMKGQKPEYVYAVLKRYKPAVYPKVDDDATIILSYPSMECIINASWNWPFNRKDMHIYGSTGYIYQDNPTTVRYKLGERLQEESEKLPLREAPYNNAFSFFTAAIRGDIVIPENDLASLKINMIVVEILEAAKKSNRTGKRVKL
jgi:predicted dehydrogenase